METINTYPMNYIYTNVNTSDNSCIEIRLGCLDIKHNYNDFDFDGEPNTLDPLVKVSHLQTGVSEPGCTDQAYAQFWNYSLVNNIDNIVYPVQ